MSPSIPSFYSGDRSTQHDLNDLDLVLLLDRSASIAGSRLRFLRQGIRQLLDALPPESARVGLVTFGPAASAAVPLTHDTARVRRALEQVHPYGATRYGAAFRIAAGLFNENSLRRQVALLCTDGETDCGTDTAEAVHLLRRRGVEVFCIGLTASRELLSQWCGTPADTHVFTADCPGALPEQFRLAGEQILGLELPDKPVCPPAPICPPCPPAPVRPECCPDCGSRCVCCLPACKSCGTVQLPPASLCDQGRLLYLSVTLKDVCPDRRIALAVILTETTAQGEEPRGMRCMTLPAQTGTGCRDVTVKCIPFVVPEDLTACGCGCRQSLCGDRCFHARILANYVDGDVIDCCGVSTHL